MSSPADLDRKRIETLAAEILFALRRNYVHGPTSRDRVYEALNALAFCTAVTIRGADKDQALAFFSDALNVCLKEASQ